MSRLPALCRLTVRRSYRSACMQLMTLCSAQTWPLLSTPQSVLLCRTSLANCWLRNTSDARSRDITDFGDSDGAVRCVFEQSAVPLLRSQLSPLGCLSNGLCHRRTPAHLCRARMRLPLAFLLLLSTSASFGTTGGEELFLDVSSVQPNTEFLFLSFVVPAQAYLLEALPFYFLR